MRRPDADPAAGDDRRDAVVILCRGASARFGTAKALARAGTDPRPLLVRVAAAYAGLANARLVVLTTADLAGGCRSALAAHGAASVEVVTGPSGGDTALTLALAWTYLVEGDGVPTHVWAHPVDLPDVGARTLAQIARVSAAFPGSVVRPVWGRLPGHPVILPASVLDSLAPVAAEAAGPWRQVWAAAVRDGRAQPERRIAVADPGVCLDHDQPAAARAPAGEGDDP